ncbi:MAG: YbaB/EbfC family nucleoid-associated protein [Candidatus Marinimicrobia bacterium]|nr:YbaB/EbfC family nucleoid-associated protein [Candidatus Neomarinimicrobiota bacterium]MCF7850984.1 YbaB/EbfC family nucleoid-associated protein [Candidatus Neomarinimicrobiota bacterium]MCF7905541.1 YbaB/EbfC family nucleoid-associated protein [Candidatus Neomarinimicrobiota bacterium]
MIPKGGMGNLMKQAQKMQKEMEKAQEELAGIEVEGSAGGGMVAVRANAKMQILSIKVEPDVLDDDVEMLEDLVLAAVNQALTNAQDAASSRMAQVTGGMGMGGLNIPGLG